MRRPSSPDPGSFRDPANRIYRVPTDDGVRILRGVDAVSLANFRTISERPFFRRAIERGHVIETTLIEGDDGAAQVVQDEGWEGVLEHAVVPFISYPYEWSFSMLKDAALLQLSLLEAAMSDGWTMKDATPFNVQFIDAKPVFIDIPSFEPREPGEPWVGYRQFCSMLLTPLMMKAYLDIDFQPILRTYLDGVPPTESVKFFRGLSRLRPGVMSHIVLPARVENFILSRERDREKAKERKTRGQSDAMQLGLVQGLRRLVNKLKAPSDRSDWSHYDSTHSYDDKDHQEKMAFVLKHVAAEKRNYVWDIGSNTGTFSRLCVDHANHVISVDGDQNAIERLYLTETAKSKSRILPLVIDLANPSPNHGWAGLERQAFDNRTQPDLVLALALIHHMRISANVPNELFLSWLRSLDCDIVIEFVNRQDEMVVKLLTNKKEMYEDYNLGLFREQVEEKFEIVESQPLKNGDREIFMIRPKD